MPDQADEALRARFRALAESEAGAAPPFARPAPRNRARWAPARRRTALAAAALLALAALAYARWIWRPRPVPYPIDLAAVTWTGPTDFLLETPGAALLRQLPAIGNTDDAARGAAPPAADDTLGRNRT